MGWRDRVGGQMSIERLARFIQANGPITLTAAIEQSGYGGNFKATQKDLYAYAAAFGKVEYKDKLWRAVSTKPSAQWIPPVRPLKHYNLLAHVRPDGMEFRAIPSNFGTRGRI